MDNNNKRGRGVTIDKEAVNALLQTVSDLYEADDIPWVIGYSGGKDSTAALQLVWMAIKQLPVERRKKPIHIINTDTLVESPIVSKWVSNSLKSMQRLSNDENLPFETHRLTPAVDNTFWVNLIGRGYPFPRKKLRWCTDRLKIRPVNDFIKSKIAEHGEIILVLGTRKAESAHRARTMMKYEKKRVRELLSPNPTLANELVFSPLENWTNDDVWLFLMQYKNPWEYSNTDLLSLYRGATADNECPLMVEKDLPSCGKSRFGCWVCTMVEQDKSMTAMISNDREKEWMTPLLQFRNEFGNEEEDRERRSFRKMNGTLQGSYGRLHHGPYLKEIREEWLEKLLRIQCDIRKNGPEEFRNIDLITIPELREIRRIWVHEKHEFDDSLPRIYERVMGEKLDDPEFVESGVFSKSEWDILRTVCNDLFPDEELSFEMMYTLLDLENSALQTNNRKGILERLERSLRNTFYRNEDDATEYYETQLKRKKELGGAYDDRFFISPDESDPDYDN